MSATAPTGSGAPPDPAAPGGTAEPARVEPPLSKVSTPYWDATRDKRLLLQHCVSCSRAVWFPRVLCPHCASAELEWREASGLGTVYAASVQYRSGSPPLEDRVPYAVALVDLDEGVRLLSNVFGCPPEDVFVGQRVRAAWEPLSDGRHLVTFEPQHPTPPPSRPEGTSS